MWLNNLSVKYQAVKRAENPAKNREKTRVYREMRGIGGHRLAQA
jgi:hypothetical protein